MTQSLAAKALQEFRNRFSYQPDGVWSAPGRVNLIGEHTDYNEGFVFPLAINRRTFAAVSPRTDSVFRVASSFSGTTHEVEISEIVARGDYDWAAYPLGMGWALAEIANKELDSNIAITGLDCYIESNVPVGAGLSSSAAIECSVGLAINDIWGLNLERKALARAAQRAENEIVGAPTGIMDQTASLFGKADHALFLDCRSLEVEPVPLGFDAAEFELLIIDTTVAHRLVDGGYAERRAACEAGAKALGQSSLRDVNIKDLQRAKDLLDDKTFKRVRHVVTENQRVIDTVRELKAHGPSAIGKLLLESHYSMRDDFEISIAELDKAVEVAMSAGAIGARMTGGGFGGAAIALTPRHYIEEVTELVYKSFAESGFAKPNIFSVVAGPGAVRDI